MAERHRSQDGTRETEAYLDDTEAPETSGRSGGQLARQVGTRDEEKSAEGSDGATRVRKSDEAAHEADGPNATQSRR